MKSEYQSGKVIDMAAPYAVASGAPAKSGFLFGVAQYTLALSEVGPFQTEGCFTLAKASADVVAVGAKLYWDDAAKNLTTTVASNLYVAVALEAKAGGTTTILCRLNGSY